VKQADLDGAPCPEGALTTAEREELPRLRLEIRVLEMERNFAGMAAAFFAKGLGQRAR
jgi:transposase-like protein